VSDERNVFSLPANPALADLAALRATLQDHADRPVAVSAGNWRRFDSLTLQFLIALQADWRARGLRLAVTDVPADIAALLCQIGLQPDLLTWEEGL
jgi:anti-anti-sigma regulatory factor